MNKMTRQAIAQAAATMTTVVASGARRIESLTFGGKEMALQPNRRNNMNSIQWFASAGLIVTSLLAAACDRRADQDPDKAEVISAKKVLFVSNREGEDKFHIFVMNPDGSEVTKLSHGKSLHFDPAWSPDGKKIVFSSVAKQKDSKADLFIMDADGSNRKQLTKNSKGTVSWSPCWFPDGKRIVFTQSPNTTGGPPEGDLYVVNADGTGLKKLGTGGIPGTPKRREGGGMLPSVSPNGKHVLFTIRDYTGEWEPRLFVMDSDGKNPRQLIKNWAMNGKWSPDGKKIAYVGGPDRETVDLHVMNSDGANSVQLTKHAQLTGIMGSVGWSHDGKQLFFDRLSDGDGPAIHEHVHVHVIDLDGKNEKRLTKGSGPVQLSFLGLADAAIEAAFRGFSP